MFPSKTILYLYNVLGIPNLVNRVVTSLDTSNVSGPDCSPLLVLKYGPKIWYILADLFKMYQKEFCFPDYWKISSFAHVFKNVWVMSTTESYCPVELLSVDDKIL